MTSAAGCVCPYLIGGGLDEAPQAYKDIEDVMKLQRQLVDVIENKLSGLVTRSTWHSIANNSSDLLIFTFGYSPSGFEDFFRKIGTPKGSVFKAKTQEEILLIAAKYGMVYK